MFCNTHPLPQVVLTAPPRQLRRYMLSPNHRHFPLEFVLILFCVANAANTRAQVITIEGHVRTVQGQPINDVRIDRLGKTDETGHFKIAADFLR